MVETRNKKRVKKVARLYVEVKFVPSLYSTYFSFFIIESKFAFILSTKSNFYSLDCNREFPLVKIPTHSIWPRYLPKKYRSQIIAFYS